LINQIQDQYQENKNKKNIHKKQKDLNQMINNKIINLQPGQSQLNNKNSLTLRLKFQINKMIK